jgi:hypothetical protein
LGTVFLNSYLHISIVLDIYHLYSAKETSDSAPGH